MQVYKIKIKKKHKLQSVILILNKFVDYTNNFKNFKNFKNTGLKPTKKFTIFRNSV